MIEGLVGLKKPQRVGLKHRGTEITEEGEEVLAKRSVTPGKGM